MPLSGAHPGSPRLRPGDVEPPREELLPGGTQPILHAAWCDLLYRFPRSAVEGITARRWHSV